jgi:hypothetical protein
MSRFTQVSQLMTFLTLVLQFGRVRKGEKVPPRSLVGGNKPTSPDRLHLLTTQFLQRSLIGMIRNEAMAVRFESAHDEAKAR